jgi:hypothetical protein
LIQIGTSDDPLPRQVKELNQHLFDDELILRKRRRLDGVGRAAKDGPSLPWIALRILPA